MNKYPKLIYDLEKIKTNIDVVSETTHSANCSLMLVTKSFCADKRVSALIDMHTGVDYFADSRVYNLVKLAGFKKKKVLLRIAQESEIEEVIKYADISFQSEIDTIKLLDIEAKTHNLVHKVVLMIDMGDLREGIFFKNREEIYNAVEATLDCGNLELHGIAVNLTCYGAIIPKQDNLQEFIDIGSWIEDEFNIDLKMFSGGNSSSYYLIEKGELPKGINNLRLGESFILGNETAYGKRIKGTHNDAVIVEAQIVELKEKPSLPIGEVGVDAFGNKPHYEDKGIMKRAIIAIGQQDIDPDGLSPMDSKINILGASSDHCILDVTNSAKNYKVGDIVSFTLGYGALLKAATSEYVYKAYK